MDKMETRRKKNNENKTNNKNIKGYKSEKPKILLIAFDGLGDRPVIKRKNNLLTPLEAAKKPNIDKLTREGITGISNPIQPGIVPGSDTGFLALFGYDPFRFYVGRGILEALGAGIEINPGEIAFRANFCTIEKNGKEWRIIDRRAGRITNQEAEELASSISKIKIEVKGTDGEKHVFEFLFYHTKSHRGVLVIRKEKGEKIQMNPLISDIDTHSIGEFRFAKALDSSENAEIIAKALNEWIKKTNETLEKHPVNMERKKRNLPIANCILTRGASMIEKTVKEGTVKYGADYNGIYGWAVSIKPFSQKYKMNAACIAGGALYKGVARYLGMEVIEVPTATAGYDTDIKAKVDAVLNALEKNDFVFLHFKGTDVAGHDGDAEMKKKFIEKADKFLKPITQLKNTIVIITADHSTPCEMKAHSADPVPILIWGPEYLIRRDEVKEFGERNVTNGGLGHIKHLDVMPIILGIVKKAEMYGT